MKKLTIPTLILSVALFACGGEATHEETTTTHEAEEAVVETEAEEETTEVATVEMTIDAVYDGKNIYVKNPYSGIGVGWCVKSVSINGDATETPVDSDAFEIDLSTLELADGDTVSITITHEEGCLPEVLEGEK